jgi:phosphatidylethanolamine-binding protein (PEBP) family uncharacterized protein
MNTPNTYHRRFRFNRICFFILVFIPASVANVTCSKVADDLAVNTEFKLSSPVIAQDSILPSEYTCDGASATLPLEWSGFPASTKYFALIMHHEASPMDIHWYWVLYNIPLSVQTLAKNATGVWALGNNSVNGNIGYAPPCSQGPGLKEYTYTIYALSEPVNITVPAAEVDREVLLGAIKNITLASASLTVIYSRNI